MRQALSIVTSDKVDRFLPVLRMVSVCNKTGRGWTEDGIAVWDYEGATKREEG